MATSTLRTLQLDFAEGIQFTKNYIQNSTFQYNTSNGWAKFNTTLTNGYPTGAISNGAASITTFAITPTNPISGNYSLQFASSSVWAAGQGFISDEFTIQREDLGKPLTFKFSYEVVANPLNANWSGQLGSQTFAVYIYDVTAGAWIQPSGFLGMNQTSGVGQVMGNFQSSVVSGQKYRLAIIALRASAGAITINFDNFFLGKEISTAGTPVTDFIDFSPTINWTGSGSTYNTTGSFRRIGDSLEVKVKISITNTISSANTELLINLPSGFTIDTTKMLSPLQGGAPTYGDAIGRDGVSGNLYLLRCQYWTNTSVKLFYQSASSGQETAVSYTVPNAWAATDTIIATFQVPVVGLSSSVQMSNATDTRVIQFYTSTCQSVTPSSTTKLINSSVLSDNSASYSVSTGLFTAPVSGIYEFKAGYLLNTGASNPVLYFYKQGTQYGNPIGGSGASNYGAVSGSMVIPLNAGETVGYYANGGGSSAIQTTYAYFGGYRLSGPSVVTATESVNARYFTTAGQTIGTTDTIINFDNKSIDSHSSVTTGASWKFVAPVSGKYLASGFITLSSTSARYVYLYINGVLNSQISIGTGSAWEMPFSSTLVNLNAGDYLDFRAKVSPSAALTTTATANYMNIIRVGN